jgi:mannose-6-phosphate isomerase-like protein (cupin superfamily)/DNA-binding XRE family transcriptional regulator
MKETVAVGSYRDLMAQHNLDFKLIGQRVKARRTTLGISTQILAKKAGLARYTVIRLEEGKPCKPETLSKIRLALHLFSDQLVKPLPPSTKFALHRASETKWTVSKSKSQYQKQLIEDDPSHVNDEKERHRLGSVGFQPFFTAVLDSELQGGLTSHAIMEFHRESWVDAHYGEEFVYCLRGRVMIRVDGDECELGPGDSMTFAADQPHQYFPIEFDEQKRAPQILIVVAMRESDKKLIRSKRWTAQETKSESPGIKPEDLELASTNAVALDN